VTHPNEELARKGYDAFGKGDLDAIRDLFDPNVQWHVPGKSQFAGDYKGTDEVLGFFGKLFEASGGTVALEIHDVLANDDHVVVFVKGTAQRDGKSWEGRSVHAFHAKDGKVVEFWEHPQDQYAVDEFWA
jgi:uncharacterized protein